MVSEKRREDMRAAQKRYYERHREVIRAKRKAVYDMRKLKSKMYDELSNELLSEKDVNDNVKRMDRALTAIRDLRSERGETESPSDTGVMAEEIKTAICTIIDECDAHDGCDGCPLLNRRFGCILRFEPHCWPDPREEDDE